jgi:hypothetical protein
MTRGYAEIAVTPRLRDTIQQRPCSGCRDAIPGDLPGRSRAVDVGQPGLHLGRSSTEIRRRPAVDSSHIRAMKGGPGTGPSPVDRGKAGSKHHLIVEAHGIPLAAITTGGNRNDVTQLIPLIQAVPPIRGRRGQPLRRPKYLYADRGYDHEVYRDKVRRFQITPHLARRGTGHGSGLGVYRWVVEGAIALLHWFRRLRIRWEIRDDIHHAFVTLGCAVICWRRLRTALCRE